MDRTVQTVQEALSSVAGGGVPDALWGVLGLGAGWMVPTPGQRRRERLATSEGRLEGGGAPKPADETKPPA